LRRHYRLNFVFINFNINYFTTIISYTVFGLYFYDRYLLFKSILICKFVIFAKELLIFIENYVDEGLSLFYLNF
jgi:hypothetical protein